MSEEGDNKEVQPVIKEAGTKDVPVAERLERLADLHEERDRLYGDGYLRTGAGMVAMFPKGLQLTTEEDFTRFFLLVHIYDKLRRYGDNFSSGGHADSLDDMAVYSQMLRRVDDRGGV